MLILASASPRRAELLTAAGIAFTTAPADIDERVLPDELAEAHVKRLAEAKARAVAAGHPGALVLGADTVVVLDGRILGKPRDTAEAAEMLRALAGRTHEVWTGVALVSGGGAEVEAACTRVWFTAMTEAEVDAYVATGEPMDKAGAYGIQGRASRYVDRIDGSYTNVVGLPVALVVRLLSAAEPTG